jgi:hypothetical protein
MPPLQIAFSLKKRLGRDHINGIEASGAAPRTGCIHTVAFPANISIQWEQRQRTRLNANGEEGETSTAA